MLNRRRGGAGMVSAAEREASAAVRLCSDAGPAEKMRPDHRTADQTPAQSCRAGSLTRGRLRRPNWYVRAPANRGSLAHGDTGRPRVARGAVPIVITGTYRARRSTSWAKGTRPSQPQSQAPGGIRRQATAKVGTAAISVDHHR